MPRFPLIAVTLGLGIVLAATGTAVSQSHVSGLSPKRLERVTAVLDKYIDAGELAGVVSLIYRHGEGFRTRTRRHRWRETRFLAWRR